MPLSFVIADDHPIILHGIGEMLEQSIHSVNYVSAHTTSEVIDQLNLKLPDVLITDYHMPQDNVFGDGMKFISYVTRHFPELKIIVFTMLNNSLVSNSLYDLGVKAVLYKDRPLKELIKAIHTVLNNQCYFVSNAHKNINADLLGNLSPREFEVVRLFVQGFKMSKIAEVLRRSVKTVSSQKNTALKKLKLKNDQELITFCNNHHLLS